MKIIYLRGIGKSCSTTGRCLSAITLLGLLCVFGAGMLWTGYRMGVQDVTFPEHQLVRSLRDTFTQERRVLEDTRTDAQERIDGLAMRLGQLQANLLRLDALGQRLVDIGSLDKGEFSFEAPSAVGGPLVDEVAKSQSVLPEILKDMDSLEVLIVNREQQLMLLEDLIMNSELEKSVHPAGRPVAKGWISSYYGMRNDPFTGKRTMHKGMDFAGKKDSDVVAVAAGVVTKAGEQSGYGYLIEINHGKGYVTRYGHNSKINVKIGDRVQQGQTIGSMGSTGRSTGPHVHFEVLRNGKTVNPTKYIRTKRTEARA